MSMYLAVFAGGPNTEQFRVHELACAASVGGLDGCIRYGVPQLGVDGPLSFEELLNVLRQHTKSSKRLRSQATHADGLDLRHPVLAVYLPNDEAARTLGQRCMLLKAIYKPFAACVSRDVKALAQALKSERLKDELLQHLGPTLSWKYSVYSIGRTVPQNEKRAIIDLFKEVPHQGPVDMVSPDCDFTVLMFHERDDSTNPPPTWLEDCALALPLGESARLDVLAKYDLKQRPYIGTTSMPPELTFVIANYGRVKCGDFVFDPFCGTGSSLVTATHLGAICLGTDMDGRVMQGGTKRDIQTKTVHSAIKQAGSLAAAKSLVEQGQAKPLADHRYPTEDGTPTMWSNFVHYGLPITPERLRMNFSVWRGSWRHLRQRDGKGDAGFIDAILCDPPYGVREQKKKVRTPEDAANKDGERRETIAGSVHAEEYVTSDLLRDLIQFSGEALVVGGRLVFWHPTGRSYDDDELPQHPCLKLIASIEQFLSLKSTRWLVIMEKVGPCPPGSVSNDACRPARAPGDLRRLLDETSCPDNPDYTAYRTRVDQAREANAAYRASGGRSTRKELTRSEQRAATMENKIKNQIKGEQKRKFSELKFKAASDPTGSKGKFTAEDRQLLWAFKDFLVIVPITIEGGPQWSNYGLLEGR